MKNLIRTLSLFCVFAFVALANAGDPDAFSIISGELISVEPEVPADTEETATEPTEESTIEPADLSSATLTISYETSNANGEAETKTLYEGAYDKDFMHVLQTDGQPQFSEAIEAKISLQVSEESDPMTISTVINPGADVHFAYIDHTGPRDEFLLVGSSNGVMNPENKFSVSGDLSFLEIDSMHTTSAFVWATFVNADGERQSKQWGPVLVKEGSFTIEGDIHRPTAASLYLGNRSSFYNGSARIIIEPKSELTVAKLGNQNREIAVVGSGYHTQVIESWQQNDEYIAMVEAWTSEYERAMNPSSDTADEDSDNADATAESEEDGADSTEDTELASEETEEAEEMTELTASESITPAEGCEEAVAEGEEPAETPQQSTYQPPYWRTLAMKADGFQTDSLQAIALNNKDPMSRLLAMQMNAFSPYENAADAISVWQDLVEQFDEEFVATYISPELERVELVHTRIVNDEALVPGQKVPEFTLASLDGEDVPIYDLVGGKDMVLIDFWASWCGPCIATFPELKKLHAAYTDENFEIVGISLDDNIEDWSGGVEDHELPWVQLGELKDADNGNPVSMSYGVNFIPKTFLVDSQGCIYRKNIHPAELKTFLVDRYGLDESLVEPEEEPEDTPEVSS